MVCPKWPRLPQHPSLFSTLYPRQAQIVMTFMNAHTGTAWLNSLSSKAVRLFGRRHSQKMARLGLLPRSFGRGRLETKEKQKKTWALESQEKNASQKFFLKPLPFLRSRQKNTPVHWRCGMWTNFRKKKQGDSSKKPWQWTLLWEKKNCLSEQGCRQFYILQAFQGYVFCRV